MITHDEALNNLATISEILVEVSKSHITANKAINEIRGLDISGIYFTLRQVIEAHESLKRDVARYFELFDKYLSNTQTVEEMHERWSLETKLIKVGKEE